MAEGFNLQEAISSEEAAILEIDNTLRTITVPEGYVFGVFNDKDVLPVLFKMEKMYGNLDLSEFQIRINFQNAAGGNASYIVTDKLVDGNYIYFSWLLGREVFIGNGRVKFVVCLRRFSTDGTITNEFNTTVARSTVLDGLEVDDPETDPYNMVGQIDSIEVLLRVQDIKEELEAPPTRSGMTYLATITGPMNYIQNGHIVVLQMDALVTATIPASTRIAVNLPESAFGEQNGLMFSDSNVYRIKVDGDGALSTLDDLPVGSYKCSMTYMA